MNKDKILELLSEITHPEYGKNIVELDMVESLTISDNSVKFNLLLKKSRDPFAQKIKRSAIDTIGNAYPEIKNNIEVIVKEAPAKEKKKQSTAEHKEIQNVIAISSCKGGVGKSTTTANLAVALAQCGYAVGVIDADVYGPSMPKLFGVEDYVPISNGDEQDSLIIPAERYGVKIMSIGFFIKSNDALVWRGPMATNALKQLLHQTAWGELDFLLIDLPPGTGDIHLTILSEIKIDGAIIVSTPQQLAIADVVRGIEMFRMDSVNINILGLVENMAWFTPKELPDNKYYIFGEEGCKKLAQEKNIPLLAQIPLIMGADGEKKAEIETLHNVEMMKYFHQMVSNILEQLK